MSIRRFSWQNPAKDKDILTPPGSPVTGDRYLIYGTGVDGWAGKDYNIATWVGDKWEFTVPTEGMHIWLDDENSLYRYNGTIWQTGTLYTPRDVNVADFVEGDFTRDSTWHINGLDLSAIVPSGAKAVMLDIAGYATAANKVLTIRRSATYSKNRAVLFSQIANIFSPSLHFTIPIDSDRKLDYLIQAEYTDLEVTVIGWYI